jgi:hypothetical protein
MTLDDCVNARIAYLTALPDRARDMWLAAAYEVFLREQITEEKPAEPERNQSASAR